LRRAPVDVTLISSTTCHLFQPLLYQVATGILSSDEVAPTTRDILSNQRNLTVPAATVTAIDLERKVVLAHALGRTWFETPYDTLIVAAGAGQSSSATTTSPTSLPA